MMVRYRLHTLIGVFLFSFSGCLFVRTSEHIISLKEDGSGEAVIHLVDIRSDARADSLVLKDFDDLMATFGSNHVPEFEQHGRRITAKRLRVVHDTLMAEVTYAFTSFEAIDGLRVTREKLQIEFSPEREVVRTNGKIGRTDLQGTRITWDRDARRLVYEVREKQVPRSTSLAFLYQKYGR